MSLQTRVSVKVLHPKHKFVVAMTDRGAQFRDAVDIQRVTDELVADAKRRHGATATIVVETRET